MKLLGKMRTSYLVIDILLVSVSISVFLHVCMLNFQDGKYSLIKYLILTICEVLTLNCFEIINK